jgi:hypothetical protein
MGIRKIINSLPLRRNAYVRIKLKLIIYLSILVGEKDSGPDLFRTFEDFEFRAAFSDRKNTPTFAAVMITKIKLPFSCLN